MAIPLDALQGLTAKQRPRLNSELCTPDHWLCFLLSLASQVPTFHLYVALVHRHEACFPKSLLRQSVRRWLGLLSRAHSSYSICRAGLRNPSPLLVDKPVLPSASVFFPLLNPHFTVKGEACSEEKFSREEYHLSSAGQGWPLFRASSWLGRWTDSALTFQDKASFGTMIPWRGGNSICEMDETLFLRRSLDVKEGIALCLLSKEKAWWK